MNNYKYKDITGERFGRLVALYPVSKRDNSRAMFWHCRCDCGIEKDINGRSLRRGLVVSCGCYHKDFVSKLNLKHGHNKRERGKSLTYKTWDKICACQ